MVFVFHGQGQFLAIFCFVSCCHVAVLSSALLIDLCHIADAQFTCDEKTKNDDNINAPAYLNIPSEVAIYNSSLDTRHDSCSIKSIHFRN